MNDFSSQKRRRRRTRTHLDGEVAPEGLRIVDEQRVDETEELHDALVLAQVLVALEQEHVGLTVAADDAELARALLRRDHLQRAVHLEETSIR